MFRSLNLHRTGAKADWEDVTPADRNAWQKLAASSRGILTPANAVSLAGAGLVLTGLIGLMNDLSLQNILLIIIGRLADFLDGYIADKTGTKSPLGETIDAGIDKLLAFAAIAGLWAAGLVPVAILALIFVHSVFNSLVGVAGKAGRRGLNPSREGKLATAASWGVLIFYPLYSLLKEDYLALSLLSLSAAYITLVLFVLLGAQSMKIYYNKFQSGKV